MSDLDTARLPEDDGGGGGGDEHKYVVYTFIYVVYLAEIRNSAT